MILFIKTNFTDKMTLMTTDHERVKSLLTEAVKLLCKSLITYRSEFSIEGLIGITVDSSEVVLVSIHEAVTTDAVSVVQTAASGICGAVETLAGGATSVILVTPDTGTDITQLVEFGGLLRDDATEIVVEAAAELPEMANTASDMVTIETGQIAGDAMPTEAQPYSALGPIQTAQIPGDTLATEVQPYSALETSQSSLFTTAELDEFIVNCPSAGIINDASCDVFAEVAITSESPPHSDKRLETSSSVEMSKEPLSGGSVADVGVPLLLPGDVDDTMPSCLSWDDDLADIGPLNLAGPQDLSLQLDKKVLVHQFLFVI